MGRIYAKREDDGRRILVEITCDTAGCDASIKPNSEIAKSGWCKRGQMFESDMGVKDAYEWHHCPPCSVRLGL